MFGYALRTHAFKRAVFSSSIRLSRASHQTYFSTSNDSGNPLGLPDEAYNEKFFNDAPKWEKEMDEHDREIDGPMKDLQQKLSNGEGLDIDESDRIQDDEDYDFFSQDSWRGNQALHEQKSKKKKLADRFPAKVEKVDIDTSVSDASMGEDGGLETAYVMGKRLFERQDKPYVVEVEEDVSDLHPYKGTRHSLYQRDKKRVNQQLSYMRKYYKKEYDEAQRKREARLKREYDIVMQLKTERLAAKRVRAHFNKLEHEKRMAKMRELMTERRALKKERREAWKRLVTKERLYQIDFLREERASRWILNPETDITEALFHDDNIITPQGSLPRGGSGSQSNFLPGRFRWTN